MDNIKILEYFPNLDKLDNQHICIRCPVCGKIKIKDLREMKINEDSRLGREIKYMVYICLDCYEDENNINLFIVEYHDPDYLYCTYTCPTLCYDKYMNLISTGECIYVS